MFRVIKKMFFVEMLFFSCNALRCISMNNQECKIRPEIININSNQPVFYPYSIIVNVANVTVTVVIILMIHAKLCFPDVVKNIKVNVFNLMLRTYETRHISWYEKCKCKCRLDASVCNNKQRWNSDKCRCERK